LASTVTVGDDGDIGHALQHSSFGQLGNVAIAAHVRYVHAMSETLVGSVVQKILRLLYVGEELFGRAALEGGARLYPPPHQRIGAHTGALTPVRGGEAVVRRSSKDSLDDVSGGEATSDTEQIQLGDD